MPPHETTQQDQENQQEIRRAAAAWGRRRLLTVTGAAAALAFTTNLPGSAQAAEADARTAVRADPFTLGVASGDPLPGSVVLWTRLAPKPYEPGSGLPKARITVRWELAHDRRFRRVVRRGKTTAHPELNHAVHVEAEGWVPTASTTTASASASGSARWAVPGRRRHPAPT